jgi:hypothetical protein
MEALDQRKDELNLCKEELEELIAGQEWARPTEANLADIQDVIDEAMREGTPAQRSARPCSGRWSQASRSTAGKRFTRPSASRRNPRFDLCYLWWAQQHSIRTPRLELWVARSI